ncbi:hypothetical protein BFN67_10530 [Pseudaminobacter manganicus]|uniref:Uncharacterized protein n=1 Tax=Manganibacter manganicus TaxID=1873176 RepID=A0A1V8RVJ4_9HYPH|nr:hypothetical protein BFN67_10530 [Pseudaminobacter manganicus]
MICPHAVAASRLAPDGARRAVAVAAFGGFQLTAERALCSLISARAPDKRRSALAGFAFGRSVDGR